MRDSVAFEDWALLIRDRLQRQAATALQRLVETSAAAGDYDRACAYAWRWIELEPWQEDAYQHLMRVLALNGQRTTALAQYDACRDILEREFGVEPSAQTLRLYEQIRDGDLAAPIQTPVPVSERPPSSPVPYAPLHPVTPAPKPVLESERRIVTLLLADVSGTTTTSQHSNTEAWVEVIAPALQLLGAEIIRLGGNVDQYRRDGLTACFGGQVAHEDDPERAVVAALAMQDAFAAYLTKISNTMGLCLRVSVHTGEVITATIGGTLTMMGKVIESAEAILTAVEPGTVWVSEETHRLIAPLFTWAADEEAGYQPLAHRPRTDKGRGIVGLSSPLVGRDAELHSLRRAVERLQTGIGGIVTVVGEAGIGKSRLVAEVRRDVTMERLAWIEGRCLSHTTNAAYQIWRDILRAWLNITADVTPDTLSNTLRQRVHAVCPDTFGDVYPFLIWLLSLPLDTISAARLQGIDAEGLQVLTFRAVEMLLECTAQQTPVVIICEDLHWADATSLALLECLLALTDHVPLLIVCVFRPVREHGCWHIREIIARDYEHRHTDVRLNALSVAESTQLVGNLLAADTLPEELRARILERAEGNPFYVEEIVRSLVDDNIIAYDEATGQWHALQEMGDLTLPDTLYGVLMARIDRLPEGAKRVLQLASVIGRIFSYPLLATIAELSTLDTHLVTLQRAQLIRERARLPEQEFIFHHQLTREATYSGLLQRPRHTLHRRVAETVERLYPERVEENLGLLAYHWEQAGDVEQARVYLQRAGEQAAAQFANVEAVGYMKRVLALTPKILSTKRYDLLMDLERLYDLLGQREFQLGILNELHTLAETLDDRTPTGAKRLGEVHQRRAQYEFLLAKFDEAIAASKQTIKLAKIARNMRLEALGHLIWARAFRVHNAQIEGAEAHLKEAIALAKVGCLNDTEAQALREMGLLYSFFLHKFDQARSYLKRCLTLYQELGDRIGESRAQNAIAASYLWEGDLVTARDQYTRALRLSHDVGYLREEGWVWEGFGETATGQGYYAEGLSCFQHSRDIFKRVGEVFGEGYMLSPLIRTHLILGQYEDAALCSRRQLQIGQDIDDIGFRVVSNIWRSEIAFRRGTPDVALEFGQRAFDEVQKGVAWHKFGILLVIGQALAALDHLEEAVAIYEQTLEVSDKPGRRASALVGLADIRLRQGQITEALKYVDEVLCEIDTADLISRTLHPAGIYLTCYRVLKAAQDEQRDAALEKAHTLLQKLAARIEDETLRRSFLENVPAHREIAAEWKRVHTGHQNTESESKVKIQ